MQVDTLLGVAKGEYFNELYFHLHKHMVRFAPRQESRNGPTMEYTQFKTIITNPYKRCIGGQNRNMNIFFLLAEALWIFAGRKDVAFLDNFNKQLKQYSDDGYNYHAPYGFRMRHYGLVSSYQPHGTHPLTRGFDQLKRAVQLLEANPDDRRVVISIWNPDTDLGTVSKDLPCNDTIMLKIREGKLNFTVANRSNDLNLGLTTNIFQFSFLFEILGNILNVPLGTQVHNSDSLHIYQDFDVTKNMLANQDLPFNDLYENARPMLMDFNFIGKGAEEKFNEVDYHVNSLITTLTRFAAGEYDEERKNYIEINLRNFSIYLYRVFHLLKIYISYSKKQFTRPEAFNNIVDFMNSNYRSLENGIKSRLKVNDIFILALNFFHCRMKNNKEELKEELATVKHFDLYYNWFREGNY